MIDDEQIARANFADADDMAEFAYLHADELLSADRAAAQQRAAQREAETVEALCHSNGS